MVERHLVSRRGEDVVRRLRAGVRRGVDDSRPGELGRGALCLAVLLPD